MFASRGTGGWSKLIFKCHIRLLYMGEVDRVFTFEAGVGNKGGIRGDLFQVCEVFETDGFLPEWRVVVGWVISEGDFANYNAACAETVFEPGGDTFNDGRIEARVGEVRVSRGALRRTTGKGTTRANRLCVDI